MTVFDFPAMFCHFQTNKLIAKPSFFKTFSFVCLIHVSFINGTFFSIVKSCSTHIPQQLASGGMLSKALIRSCLKFSLSQISRYSFSIDLHPSILCKVMGALMSRTGSVAISNAPTTVLSSFHLNSEFIFVEALIRRMGFRPLLSMPFILTLIKLFVVEDEESINLRGFRRKLFCDVYAVLFPFHSLS